MSWSIDNLDNDVEISPELEKKILKAAKKHGSEELVEVDGGYLVFNSDHCEHMDYIGGEASDWIVDLLKKAKVKGRITFRDTESCNPPAYWGHEFDGKGGYVQLTGTEQITWKQVEDK